MNKIGVGILTSFILLITSCEVNGNNPCSDERETTALITDFPDSIKVGFTETIGIRYILENSCGDFERFDVTMTDQAFEVKMITNYEGCSCNLEFTEEITNFEINLDFPGIYEYKFWQAEGDYDSRVVKVFE